MKEGIEEALECLEFTKNPSLVYHIKNILKRLENNEDVFMVSDTLTKVIQQMTEDACDRVVTILPFFLFSTDVHSSKILSCTCTYLNK